MKVPITHLWPAVLVGVCLVQLLSATQKNSSNTYWSVDLGSLPEWNPSEINIPFGVEVDGQASATLVDSVTIENSESVPFQLEYFRRETMSLYWDSWIPNIGDSTQDLRISECLLVSKFKRECSQNPMILKGVGKTNHKTEIGKDMIVFAPTDLSDTSSVSMTYLRHTASKPTAGENTITTVPIDKMSFAEIVEAIEALGIGRGE